MKNFRLLPLFATLSLLVISCDQDPPPLNLDTWDVRWYDDDQSGNNTAEDALHFNIYASTTDSDSDDQYFTEWEFSYTVNDKFGGVLLGNEREHANSLTVDLDITLDNLAVPGAGSLQKKDVVAFRFWAIDNCGTTIEQEYRYVLED